LPNAAELRAIGTSAFNNLNVSLKRPKTTAAAPVGHRACSSDAASDLGVVNSGSGYGIGLMPVEGQPVCTHATILDAGGINPAP
jgi:hypothetical protein